MAQDHDIRLPHDTLARRLTREEVEEVSGGTFEGDSPWIPDTTASVTGTSPPQGDYDWD